MFSKFKKSTAVLFAACFVLSAAVSFWPGVARAQGATESTTVMDIPRERADAIAKSKTILLNSKEYAITNAILTAVNAAAQRIAANAATFIVSGGKGKSPLAYITGWNNWHDNILMDSVSDSLNTLSNKYLGFGICQPLNTQLDLRIKLGIARLYAPKPNCTFNQAYNAAIQTKNNISSGKFLNAVTLNFEMGSSPLSIALNTQYAVVNKSLQTATNAINQRLTSPYKPLTDLISGDVKTPANIIEETSMRPINTMFDAYEDEKDIVINKTDLLAAVGANALKVFSSTLVSKAFDKYLKGGTLTGKDILCASSAGKSFDLCKGVVNQNLAAGTPAGSTDASLASAYFASLFTPSVSAIDDYSPINDLSACPAAPEARGVWNCVIDQGFVQALSAGDKGYLSVADAMAAGSLHGAWNLVPPNDPRNIAPDCYNTGYCYTNLVKLRRMRIIPVGWEMAADAGPVTLDTAVKAFNDASSPYYRLIDPDWILKVPVTQCRAQATGQTLAAPNTSERADVCVDAPSCISEDGNGKCTGGYGYCTRERAVWRIDATECPVQYASCDSFSDQNGKDISVLKNTVDAASCNAENAGCRPYATVAAASGWSASQPAIFLNSQAQECDAKSAGCRSLQSLKTASTANLISNPGLETPNAAGTEPDGWNFNRTVDGNYFQDGVSAYEGIAAYRINGQLTLDTPIPVEPNMLYTLSFYGRGLAGIPNMKAAVTSATGFKHVPYEPTCLSTSGANDPCFANLSAGASMGFGSTETVNGIFKSTPGGWERFSLTFSTGLDTTAINAVLDGGTVDAIQLERGATATAFHVGGSESSGLAVNLKAPPAYLGCTGEPNSDAGKGCSAYAPVCRQSEVGCDSFSPRSGGAEITAVASSNDACSAQCVGYSTFKQEPTLWASARFPLYFIPSTAKSCSLSDVGCDEFTNLEAAATGGESKAYYTHIRACRQPDAGSDGNYFTWEGSDASGYQLKSYVLVNVASGDGTMMAVANTAANFVPTATPTDPPQPNPPGPVYLTGADPAACTQDIYKGANGATKNPDCRELINAGGDIFYRLLSATITATADCKTYRKTLSTQPDCTGSGGVWTGGVCDYFTLPAESRSCSASVNGCRAYTGNQGNNVRSIFLSTLENNQLDNWTGGAPSGESTAVGEHSYAATTAQRGLAYSNGTSILNQGRAYTLTVWAKGRGNLNALLIGNNILPADRSQYFADPTKTAIALTAEWQRYVLGPVIMNWAPDGSNVLQLGAAGGAGYFDNIELTETQGIFALVASSWKTPAICDQTPAGQALPQAQLGCAEYSSKNGAAANLKSFDHLCREQAVGCEAFTDTQGTDTPFASFRNALCAINAEIDKSNSRDCLWLGKTVCSVAPSEATCRFDFDGSEDQLGDSGSYTASVTNDTFIIPPDGTLYLVNDGKATCDAASVGCTALGENDLNALDANKHRVPWKLNGNTVYKTIDPANLSRELCTQDAVSCQAWSTTSGGKAYFKDPGAALCEYKDKATYNGNDVSGWFKKGTSEPCDVSFIIGGKALGIRKNLDPEFGPDNFAGICPAEQASCTEFTDHADAGKTLTNGSKEFPSGRPFYYLNDQRIKDATAACDGKVSQKQGCLVLDQTDNRQKIYDTAATYKSSDDQGFKMVAPVSGAGNDANIIMKVTRDRVCSEWLECNTDQTVTDPKTGRDTTRCLGLGSCIQKGADGRCLVWGQLQNPVTFDKLDAGVYKGRDVTSSGSDYSGFSIPKQLSVAFYKQTKTGAADKPVYKLNTRSELLPQSCKVFPEADSPFPKTVLADPTGLVSSSRKSGFNNTNVCEYQASDLVSRNGQINNVPIGEDCECSYRKALYGTAITKYFPAKAESGTTSGGSPGEIKQAVCSGGSYDGQECWPLATGNRIGSNDPNGGSPNLSCANGDQEGSCESLVKIDSVIGEKGYCLERDETLKVNGSDDKACITWLPIDSAQGRDTANQFTSAAFIPKIGQERYCAAPAKYCVPHDCANSPEVPAVCTELRWADLGDLPPTDDFPGYLSGYGCFRGCHNATCVQKQSDVCVPIIQDYCRIITEENCGLVTKRDPSCPEGQGDKAGTYCMDIYEQCVNHKDAGTQFCRNMGYFTNDAWINGHHNCLKDNNYSTDFACTEDLIGIDGQYYGGHVSTWSRETVFRQNPYSNVDAFCGFDTSGIIDPVTRKTPADSWNNDLTGCATSGTQFCGNGEACSGGTECAAMNDLSVHQTEYTMGETKEDYPLVCSNDILGKRCSKTKNYSSVTKTVGAHSFFGASSADKDGKYIPLLSSASLEFKLAEQSGDWINIYNTADEEGNIMATSGNSLNVSTETNGSSPIIGSYPIDLVGLYYFGKPKDSGNASVSYDLVRPSLLLTSQIDRVVIKVLSVALNGLCQYGNNTSGANTGECSNAAGPKGIFYNDIRGDNNYGYDPTNVKTTDDEAFAADHRPSFVTLTDANNWSSQLSSGEGSATFTLLISNNDPKRVVGIRIDLFDQSKRGYIYVAGLDVHLRGPVCGAATYVGSSNPTAEPALWPVVYTNSVNSVRGFNNQPITQARGGIFKYDAACTPFGAFSASNPQTYVTDSQAQTDKKICELDKGGITAGTVEQQKIFAKVVGINQFNDTVGNFSGSSLAVWPINGALTPPTVGSININGTASGTVTGVGSLRANLKFSATADLDHLPIRRVIIKWGDGADDVDSGLENYYKNHNDKVCQSSTDATHFANTPNACDSKPFAYSHVYSCAAGNTCVYVPEITVIDNWGLGQNSPHISPVSVTITSAQ